LRLPSVERNGGIEIGSHPHGECVGDAATEAEANDTNLAGAVRTAPSASARLLRNRRSSWVR
jgi:hypothetical protein